MALRAVLAGALIVLAVTAASCGGDGDDDAEATTPAAAPATTAGTGETVTLELLEGLSGTAVVLDVSPPKRFPGDVQPATISTAACAEVRKLKSVEELEKTVQSLLTEVRGGRSRTTAARSLAELTAGGFSVVVHQQNPPYNVVVCGDIPSR